MTVHHLTKYFGFVLFAAVVCMPPTVAAQDDTDTNEELSELRSKVATQDEALSSMNERLEELEEAKEQSEFEAIEASQQQQKKFEIYGFFDLMLMKQFVDKDSFFNGLVNDNLTFMISHLNLYFSSQMTQTLSALAEIRFSFSPLGDDTTAGSIGFPAFGVEYDRVDTSSIDPFNGEIVQFGSINIERVHLTWKPFEFFGVIAGHFLTPFGIWNIDHGSPVLITVRQPFTQVQGYIPLSQTGVQIFGRFIPKSNFYIDYAVTLSNGEGPTNKYFDYDNNKAVGARLRLDYRGSKVRIAAGGYGFFGHTTDIVKNGSLDPSFHVEIEEVEKYKQWLGAVDLLIELYGLRLQGEYLHGIILYDTRPVIIPGEGVGTGWPADYIKKAGYGLAAYTLPLGKWLKSMTLAPYYMIELSNTNDNTSAWGLIQTAGLNFRPSPYVVLKAEYEYTRALMEDENGHMTNNGFWGILSQVAVSF